jgi:hypothetical protein
MRLKSHYGFPHDVRVASVPPTPNSHETDSSEQGQIKKEQVWPDMMAILNQLQPNP